MLDSELSKNQKKRAAPVTPNKRILNKKQTISLESDVEALLASLDDLPLAGRVKKFSLKEAVQHCATADGGRLERIVCRYGAPPFYFEKNTEDQDAATDTFRSLCRIIVGQQLAGGAVRAIWAKFTSVMDGRITPGDVLARNLGELQKASGLSGAKARAIADLSSHYSCGDLSDALLLDPRLSPADLSSKLLAVKGIGPWSANMYQIFSLHLPDVFPTGDLGVRNGVARTFDLRGSGRNGALNEKKDMDKLQTALEPYKPYRSVASWYMWQVLEKPS